MQITLAESAAASARPSPWVGASLIAHVAAVSLLLLRGANGQAYLAPEPESLTYVEPRQDPAPPIVSDTPPAQDLGGHGVPVAHIPLLDIPPVVPPPMVELANGPADFDAAAFDRRGLASTLLALVPTAVRPVLGGVFDVTTVDMAVRPVDGNPTPRYPSALASAGVEGEVAVRFVVDTTGRVETGSVKSVRSTHALFEREVHDVLRRMRFLAAESGGVKVRQLVEQTFRFEIGRGRE